jgi:hypothetical protein
MTPRQFILAGLAWLLTVAFAFSIGRLVSPGSTRFHPIATGIPTGPASTAAGAKTSPASAPSDDASLAAWFGSKPSELKEVLGGRTLKEHVQHLLAVDDEATRMLGFLRLIESLATPDDIKSVLEIIGSDPNGRFRMTEQSMLLQKWAKLEPAVAAKYASGLRDFSRYNGLNAVLRTWVKADPDQAIDWAVKNGAPSPNSDPRQRGPGGEDNWAVATLIPALAKTNLDRALTVAAEQPYGRARGRMVETLVSELVSQRGEEAARTAVLDLGDDAFRAGLAGRLADQMAGKNPEAAAAWANGLPAGETRQRALADAVSRWAESDAVAAGNYLKQLGNSPEVDRAKQDYAQRVVRNDPEGALAWTQAIADKDRRTSATQEVLSSWMRRDATAAQTWSQANGVPLPTPRRDGGFPRQP